jgi:predicted transglutaminase-like cysteine proteinase
MKNNFEIVKDQITETPQLTKLLREINKKINSFPYKKDIVKHNQLDYWSSLIDKHRAGDCDDYALTKRRHLIESGVPYQCLFPTICIANGEGHLVLIVRTNLNDLLMDNIEKNVVSIKKVNYKWLYRLDPLANNWVSLV